MSIYRIYMVLFPIALVWAGVCAWYFFTHCWNVPAAQMTAQCLLLISMSK